MKTKTQDQVITVKVNEQNPEPLNVIAESIIEVSEAFKRVQSSNLTERAIVLLLQDMTGLSQRDIKSVLEAAPKLSHYYTKKQK